MQSNRQIIQSEPSESIPLQSGFYVKKAQDLGCQLPIGELTSSGNLVKSFSLRELSTKRERALGYYRKKNPFKPNTNIVTNLLAFVLERLGDQEVKEAQDLSADQNTHYQNVLRIRNLWMADVFYMFLRCRINELGSDFSAPWQCELCGEKAKINADLEDMDVICCDDPKQLRVKCDLRRGLVFRDGSTKKSVLISPVLWGHMELDELIDIGVDALLMKLFFVSKCIVGVNDFKDEIVLTNEEINTIKKIDRELISDKINEMNLGPSLNVTGKCPNKICMAPYQHQINWDYDSFFSIASL